MPLMSCKLCGKAFVSEGLKVCSDCMHRLEDVYYRAHDFLRDSNDDKLDAKHLADEMGVDPRDIQELIEMGWLERDLEIYSRKKGTRRQRQYEEFSEELEKMKEKSKVTSYGGEIYARRPRNK